MPRTPAPKKTAKKSAGRLPARLHRQAQEGKPRISASAAASGGNDVIAEVTSRGEPAGDRVPEEAPVRMDVPEDLLSAPEMPASAPPQKESESPDEALQRHPRIKDRYFEAVGRRKTAIVRARLFTKTGDFTVNGRAYGAYFPEPELQRIVEDALKKMKLWERFRVSVKVSGGGVHAQAEAVRHALARCLIKFNPDFRKRLKRAGFLMRDPRAKERKKFGLKKARRAPQWQKR